MQEVFIKTNEACLGYVYVILKTAYFTVTISEKLLQDHLEVTLKKAMNALLFFLTAKEKYQIGWYEIAGFLTDVLSIFLSGVMTLWEDHTLHRLKLLAAVGGGVVLQHLPWTARPAGRGWSSSASP